jgi:hypothetical protein
MQALIYLYLPTLKGKFDTLTNSIFQFSARAAYEQESNNPPQVWKNASEEYKEYRKNLDEIRIALEKLVG